MKGIHSIVQKRHKIRYVIALKDPNVPSLRYVNIPEKIKDLMLITYLFSTYPWYFSVDPTTLIFQVTLMTIFA